MDLLKRFNDWRYNPLQKVVALIPQLQQLKSDLTNNDTRPLYGIVQFFDQVSAWHDRSDEIGQLIVALQETNHGQHSELISYLETLRNHFCNAGRDLYGWNRTEKGETVTADKVYLGNIYGLLTYPASYWQKKENEPKGQWEGGMWQGCSVVENKNSYDIVSDQARKFMESHTRPMCALIDWISQNVKITKRV